MWQVSTLKKHTKLPARILSINTAHGTFETPCFMPVATRAGLNCMRTDILADMDVRMMLGGNTYHMLVAPGMEVIERAGGMHKFMHWPHAMLTDSGGFQVFSLSKNTELCVIDDEGAHFKHPDTGEIIHMTPECSLQTQKIIGADIIMAFDQCTPDDFDEDKVRIAMTRTHRWLKQSLEYHLKHPNSIYGHPQALFGIVQGGKYWHLREESLEVVNSLPLSGIAIGGESIGFDMQKTIELARFLRPMMPEDKPRYTMGVGLSPQDLCDVVKEGIDMFDCVAPTRNARHGALYSGTFVERDGWLRFESSFDNSRLQIKKRQFADDESPIMTDCNCDTCSRYTRAHLHFLFKQKSILFAELATIHNLYVMHETCQRLKRLIACGEL